MNNPRYCRCSKKLVNSTEIQLGLCYKCILEQQKLASETPQPEYSYYYKCNICGQWQETENKTLYDAKECEPCYRNSRAQASELLILDDPYNGTFKYDPEKISDWYESLKLLKEFKVSAIKQKSLFRWAAVRNIRNNDLVIVNQELISDGVILATSENDARTRVGATLVQDNSAFNMDDVEVVVVSF